MAIPSVNELITLTVGMFGAAPGASVLTELDNQAKAGASINDIANGLASTSVFTGIYPTFLTNEQFATDFVANLFTETAADVQLDLVALATSILNSGTSRGELIVMAINALAGVPEADATYGASAAALNNQVEVAYDYTVNHKLSGSSLEALQDVIGSVDSSQASVDAALLANANLDNIGTTYTFTTGVDAFTGGARNDTLNALSTGTFNALDTINGGAGNDTLNIADNTGAVDTTGAVVTNVETANIASSAGVTANTTSWTGLTKLSTVATGATDIDASATTDVTASVAAQAGNAVSIDGAKDVKLTTTGQTTGTVNIGTTTAVVGEVTANVTGSAANAGTTGAIAVTGGTTVAVTAATTNSSAAVGGANGTATQGAITVTGTSNTTDVSVSQNAAKALTAGNAAVTETHVVTWTAFTGLAVGTVSAGGMTITSDGSAAFTAAQIADVAQGGVVAGLTITTAPTAWTASADTATTTTFTSTTASANVADISGAASTGAGVLPTFSGAVQGAALNNGSTGTANGAISITDANAASTTAAGTITTVSINNFGAGATVNSGALSSLTLDGTGSTVNAATSGALTTATATTLALNLKGMTSTGAVTLDTDVKTLNVASTDATNTLASLVASGATAVNISGDKNLVLSAQTFGATAAITSTSTGAVTLGTALATGQSYAGGSGVDTITLTAGGTKAITTGAGDDVVTYAGAIGTGGSVDAGDGTDTIVMTAALAEAATASTAFAGKVSNFEVLKLSAATGGIVTINMANADGINRLDTNGVTGGALTVTNAAANFTLVQRADLAIASSVSLADNTGTADNVNLVYTAADGFTSAAALTVAGVENITITTTDANTTAQTAVIVTPITAAAAATVTVSGNMGVSLIGGMTQTTLTSLDASGLTASGAFGGLTFTSGALAAAATIKGGAAGTNVIDFSAATKVVTYTGGSGADTINFAGANTQANVVDLGNGTNAFNGGTLANGDNTITGGTGIDNIAVGTGANTINLGGGTTANSVTVGAAAGLNVITTTSTGVDTMGFTGIQTAGGFYTSLNGWAKNDVINFTDAGTTASEATLGAKITLGAVANFANYLDAATADAASGALNWFQFSGNTYITVDNSANATFADGVDTVIELVGLVDLSGAVNVAGVLTLA